MKAPGEDDDKGNRKGARRRHCAVLNGINSCFGIRTYRVLSFFYVYIYTYIRYIFQYPFSSAMVSTALLWGLFFYPTAPLCCYGGLFSPVKPRRNPLQLQPQVPGKVPEGIESSGV